MTWQKPIIKQHVRQRIKKHNSTTVAGDDYDAEDDWQHAGDKDRLATWQVAGLLCFAGAVLYFAVHSVPFGTTKTGRSATSNIPKCFPLEDKDTVRLLGAHNTLVDHKIATDSEWAQTLFNLGLLQLHGFNQLEAIKMFEACVRSDPDCAMCYWGLAYAMGPMPNKVPGRPGDSYPSFLPQHATEAQRHIQKAVEYNQQAMQYGVLDLQLVQRDKQYIEALAGRLSKGAAALTAGSWREQEAKYAQQMKDLADNTKDADAYALAAEAFMNLSPWDYYNEDGSLRPTAATAEQLLRKALAINPAHTHALHLHIHIAEAGAAVEEPGKEAASAARALKSAETLADLNAQHGHLIHMASHIFVRVGQYKKAVTVNKAAYDFDLGRGQHCMVPYLPEHNVNMLVYAASMAGMLYTAEAYATGMRDLRLRMPDDYMARGSEWVNLPTVHIRYGVWNKLLSMAAPLQDSRGVTSLGGSQYAKVVYHSGRMLALIARAQSAAQQVLGLHDVTAFDLARRSLELREKEVAQEHRMLQLAVQSIPLEPVTKPGAGVGMYASGYASLARIMINLAEARLHLLHNHTSAAVDRLKEAVSIEDGLGYMEPPRVHQPVRQCLGWLLLHTGQLDEAWQVYSKDLLHHPHNGWSLLGLQQVAEAKQQSSAEAAVKVKKAWADAEVAVPSSCPMLSQPYTA